MNTSERLKPALTIALALTFVAALVFWFKTYEPDPTAKMVVIIVLAGVLLAVPIYRSFQRTRDARAGVPVEDELLRERRLLAGARAFHFSLYLWLGIFVFNSHFSEREEMLGIGILGSAALYGICWLHLKLRGHGNAHQA